MREIVTAQAAFAFATFSGLVLETITLGGIADRWGRRAAFRGFAFCYAAATTVMAMQNTAIAIDTVRLIDAIAIGAQLITLDAYASEIVPGNLLSTDPKQLARGSESWHAELQVANGGRGFRNRDPLEN